MQTQKLTKKVNKIDHYTKTKQRTNKLTIKQSVKGLCTNIWYKLGGQSILAKKTSDSNFNSIYLLGKSYSSIQQLQKDFHQLYWFTYRKQINLLSEITTDVGWGCLIRVGQMLLANSIKRYFQIKQFQIDQTNILTGMIFYLLFLKAFLDDQQGVQAKYSFEKILKKGMSTFNLKIGQWFNISQICHILMYLQNKTPMKGAQDLKMIYFNQTLLFLDQIFQKISINMCKCQNQKIQCQMCNGQINYKKNCKKGQKKSFHEEQNIYEFKFLSLLEEQEEEFQQVKSNQSDQKRGSINSETESQTKLLTFDILLVVSTRISHKDVSKEHYQSILEFLNLPSSMGIIGGVPHKGLYFVGSLDENIIYLDPHLVQTSVNRSNLVKQLQSFHCNNVRVIGRQKLDSSLAFAFYLRNLKDLNQLIQKIQYLKQVRPDAVPISYLWQNQFRDINQSNFSYQPEMDQYSPDFSFIA